jgi:hypothetical protein
MKQTLKVVKNQETVELQNLVKRRLKKQGDGRIYDTIVDVDGVQLVLNGKIKFLF